MDTIIKYVLRARVEAFEEKKTDREKVNHILGCMWFLVRLLYSASFFALAQIIIESETIRTGVLIWGIGLKYHQYNMNFVLWHAESKTKRDFRCVRERIFWCGQILICNFKNRNNLCACVCMWESFCKHCAYVIWMKSCRRRAIFRFVIAVFRLSLTLPFASLPPVGRIRIACPDAA